MNKDLRYFEVWLNGIHKIEVSVKKLGSGAGVLSIGV